MIANRALHTDSSTQYKIVAEIYIKNREDDRMETKMRHREKKETIYKNVVSISEIIFLEWKFCTFDRRAYVCSCDAACFLNDGAAALSDNLT